MIKVALCQFKTTDNKIENLNKCRSFIEMAKAQGSQIIVLPEMFNCPYEGESFDPFSEFEGGESFEFLQEMSQGVILIGGSIPEKDSSDNHFNTSYIFEDQILIGKHRKVHLFDIDLEGVKMQESSYLKGGNQATVVNTSLGPIGVCICFDIRFPELFLEMSKEKPILYAIPAAFNQVTGPAHYALLARSRSVDFQAYVALCSPASNTNASYNPYGHSLISNPWGEILGEMDGSEGIIIQSINPLQQTEIKHKLPLGR